MDTPRKWNVDDDCTLALQKIHAITQNMGLATKFPGEGGGAMSLEKSRS
jgi:hypothetical protein